MKYIHQREHLNEDDIVVIECSQTCNIRLMTDANFRAFKNWRTPRLPRRGIR